MATTKPLTKLDFLSPSGEPVRVRFTKSVMGNPKKHGDFLNVGDGGRVAAVNDSAVWIIADRITFDRTMIRVQLPHDGTGEFCIELDQ